MLKVRGGRGAIVRNKANFVPQAGIDKGRRGSSCKTKPISRKWARVKRPEGAPLGPRVRNKANFRARAGTGSGRQGWKPRRHWAGFCETKPISTGRGWRQVLYGNRVIMHESLNRVSAKQSQFPGSTPARGIWNPPLSGDQAPLACAGPGRSGSPSRGPSRDNQVMEGK